MVKKLNIDREVDTEWEEFLHGESKKPKTLTERWAEDDVVLKVDTKRKDTLRKRFKLDLGDKNGTDK